MLHIFGVIYHVLIHLFKFLHNFLNDIRWCFLESLKSTLLQWKYKLWTNIIKWAGDYFLTWYKLQAIWGPAGWHRDTHATWWCCFLLQTAKLGDLSIVIIRISCCVRRYTNEPPKESGNKTTKRSLVMVYGEIDVEETTTYIFGGHRQCYNKTRELDHKPARDDRDD